MRGGCRIEEYKLTERDRKQLLAVRDAAKDLQEAEDALKELELKTIGSPNMDGMPKGSSQGDANARHLIHLEYARAKRDKAEYALKKAKHNAHRVCRRLDGHMRKFCESYYAEGHPFDVAQIVSGVKEAQCYRYMAKVKGE